MQTAAPVALAIQARVVAARGRELRYHVDMVMSQTQWIFAAWIY